MEQVDLKTGDILLFDNGGCNPISMLIKYFTSSNITHVAMVLKDPDFIDPPLKGYYAWESNYEGEPDPQDNEVKFGVQITPLDEICDKYREKNSEIYTRSINCCSELLSKDHLKEVHSVVYDKKYDFYLNDLNSIASSTSLGYFISNPKSICYSFLSIEQNKLYDAWTTVSCIVLN